MTCFADVEDAGTGTDADAPKKTIEFKFTNIKRPGVLIYAVYCNEEDFKKSDAAKPPKPSLQGAFPVLADVEAVQKIDIPAIDPECALLFFIDENGNGVLDRSGPFGLPDEAIGFSRITRKPMSKPKWANAKFELATTEAMAIRAFYY